MCVCSPVMFYNYAVSDRCSKDEAVDGSGPNLASILASSNG